MKKTRLTLDDALAGLIGFEHAAQAGSDARSGIRRVRGFRVEARHVTWASGPSAWNTTVCRASTGLRQIVHLTWSLICAPDAYGRQATERNYRAVLGTVRRLTSRRLFSGRRSSRLAFRRGCAEWANSATLRPPNLGLRVDARGVETPVKWRPPHSATGGSTMPDEPLIPEPPKGARCSVHHPRRRTGPPDHGAWLHVARFAYIANSRPRDRA